MGEVAGDLLTRITDREAQARDVHESGCHSSWWEHDRIGYDVHECNCGEPARILAWCTALRAIVEEHATQNVPVLEVQGEIVMSGPECRVCVDWTKVDMDGPPPVPAPCRTLQLVAQAIGL